MFKNNTYLHVVGDQSVTRMSESWKVRYQFLTAAFKTVLIITGRMLFLIYLIIPSWLKILNYKWNEGLQHSMYFQVQTEEESQKFRWGKLAMRLKTKLGNFKMRSRGVNYNIYICFVQLYGLWVNYWERADMVFHWTGQCRHMIINVLPNDM